MSVAPLPAALSALLPPATSGASAAAAPAGAAGPFAMLLGQAGGLTAADPAASPGTELAGQAAADLADDVGLAADAAGEVAAESAASAAAAQAAAAALPAAPWPPPGLGGLFASGAGGGMQAAVVDAASPDGLHAGRRGAGLTSPLPARTDIAGEAMPGAPGAASALIMPVAAGTTAASLPAPAAGTIAAADSSGMPSAEAGPPTAATAATDALAAAAAAAAAPEVATEGFAAAAAETSAVATAEGAEPPSPAFALPPLATPPAAREAAPLLAAPAPPPDLRAGDFGERFGAQLQWMAEQNIGHARIRVTPQELGPVEVLLRMDGDSISADFSSPHAETRQALEQGLPRLRDLLGEHGFQLAHAGVGSDAPPSRDDDRTAGATSPGGDAAGAADGEREAAPVRTLRGLVDAYA